MSLIKSYHKKASAHSLTWEAAVEVGITVEPIELRIHYESFTYKQKNHTQTFHFNARGRQCVSDFFGLIRKCFLFWNERRNARLDSLQEIIPLYCSVIMQSNWKKKTENEKRNTFDGTCVTFETNNEHELIWSAITQNLLKQINVNLYIQKATKLLKPFASCRYLEVWCFYTEFCVFHPDLILLCPPVCSSIPLSVSEDSPVSLAAVESAVLHLISAATRDWLDYPASRQNH